jgi:hypothetical protein
MNFYQSTEAFTVGIFGSKPTARAFNRAIFIFEIFNCGLPEDSGSLRNFAVGGYQRAGPGNLHRTISGISA